MPASPPWANKTVLVIGLDNRVNQSVVKPLQDAGVRAAGAIAESADVLPEITETYDLIAIGRGAAGPAADRLKAALAQTAPATQVIDVIAPNAIQHILSALDPDTPRLKVDHVQIAGRKLHLRLDGDPGAATVVEYSRGDGQLVRHELARLTLGTAHDFDLTLPAAPHSLVVDLDGRAFWHQPVVDA